MWPSGGFSRKIMGAKVLNVPSISKVAGYLLNVRIFHKGLQESLGEGKMVVYFLKRRVFSLWSTTFAENFRSDDT